MESVAPDHHATTALESSTYPCDDSADIHFTPLFATSYPAFCTCQGNSHFFEKIVVKIVFANVPKRAAICRCSKIPRQLNLVVRIPAIYFRFIFTYRFSRSSLSFGNRMSAFFHFSFLPPVLSSVLFGPYQSGATHMEWTTPQHEEIDLNCEVSSYANAEL